MLRSQIKTITVSALAVSLAMSALPTAALAQRFIPQSNGLPGRREGGGARGCEAQVTLPQATAADARSQKAMMAMVPANTGATTLSAYPTFFWYVAATTAPLEFILADDQGQELYKTQFKTNGEAGIISLSLPQNANIPPLALNKGYRWSFALICDATEPSGNIVMEGWVQRMQPSPELAQQLATANGQERAKLYAAHGIWHEAIATLANLRYLQPNDTRLQAEWNELLSSVDLGYWATQPLAVSPEGSSQSVSSAVPRSLPSAADTVSPSAGRVQPTTSPSLTGDR